MQLNDGGGYQPGNAITPSVNSSLDNAPAGQRGGPPQQFQRARDMGATQNVAKTERPVR